MPSILFHELVGNKIAKKYKKYDTCNFYFGIIAPDAVNAYGFADKEKRWSTHLRAESLEQWKENIIEFYKRNYNKYENTYLMGYLVHVLTDIICDEIYQKVLYPDLLKNGLDYNSAYSYYETAIEKLENSNINEQWWKEVQKKLKKGEKIPINSMNEKILKDWENYTIKKYQNRKYEEKGYLKDEFVDEVVKRVENILVKEEIIQ